MPKVYATALSFLAGILLAPTPVAGQEGKELPEALQQAYGAFATAMVQGDAEKAAAFYAKDAVVLVDHEHVFRGRSAIREDFLDTYLASPEGEAGEGSGTEIEVDRVAAEEGLVTLAGRYSSQAGNGGIYSNTWQRQADGGWKLAVSVMTFESLENDSSF
ncbi:MULTISPECIES: DUF4440 domain-containing protein [unclassified Wenzhouxiangella]|uniref:YybH family protein n=1 Tax=unclassified Wenzhouxiangella TaxID=2613841 RepID=UPI000E329405|nr:MULTISPECIES: DUF4440 domain-containing protein [unclassified Wenzhouxiangella]RFF27270.1 DUF4440 domain-containing protein [Wenzhouxiangella sp. 15181]RFP69272.1 DUF4440 domain-containing protein [Wenzhouxiangella sp. 15190]